MKDAIRNWLTEQFGSDEALIDDLYGQYCHDMNEAVAELPRLLAAGDAKALGEKGHAMKGMALQMGDTELSGPCLCLQEAGRAGDLAACETLVPSLTAVVSAL